METKLSWTYRLPSHCLAANQKFANLFRLGLAITVLFTLGHRATASAYSFTILSLSGYNITPEGVNDLGQITGYATQEAKPTVGFIYSGGNFTFFSVPGSSATYAYGINNSGEIVGYYSPIGGLPQPFIDDAGQFTKFQFSGTHEGAFHGINNNGQIVGTYDAQGLLYNGGNLTTFNMPGPLGGTEAFGINDSGEIAGFTRDNAGDEQGYAGTIGNFSPVDFPLNHSSQAFGINDSGEIVGGYGNGGPEQGFVDIGGTFSTVDEPNSLGSTNIFGVNNLGEIVGNFQDGIQDAYFAVPITAVPEPPAYAALLGVTALAAAIARRNRCWREPTIT